MGPMGTPWDPMGPMGPLGTTWDHLGPLGTKGPNGTMGPGDDWSQWDQRTRGPGFPMGPWEQGTRGPNGTNLGPLGFPGAMALVAGER